MVQISVIVFRAQSHRFSLVAAAALLLLAAHCRAYCLYFSSPTGGKNGRFCTVFTRAVSEVLWRFDLLKSFLAIRASEIESCSNF